MDEVAFTKGVVTADYDNDGYVDFYVSNLNGSHFLYHNNHDRTFTDVAAKAGVQKPLQSFPAWFFDYDNDGWPDLFATSYYISVDESIRTYLGLQHNAETLRVYRNMRDGTFRDVTESVGLDKVFMFSALVTIVSFNLPMESRIGFCITRTRNPTKDAEPTVLRERSPSTGKPMALPISADRSRRGNPLPNPLESAPDNYFSRAKFRPLPHSS